MKLHLAPLLPLLLASLVGACASSAEPQDEGEQGVSELNAQCRYPRRYIAVMKDGPCAEVPAARGRWVPSPLFAAEDGFANACVYNWDGERYARVDREALNSALLPYSPTGAAAALSPSCSSSNSAVDLGAVESIPLLDSYGMAGAVGCDVCGRLKDQKIWVVLPPERIITKQFEVKLSNGASQFFQIEAAEEARAVVIDLPTPPAGLAYVEGSIAIN